MNANRNNAVEHPSEEMLERFLMSKSPEAESTTVETHILACDDCVARMEVLEDEISEMKLVLQQWQQERAAEAAKLASRKRDKDWWLVSKLKLGRVAMPQFVFAGGLAALALGVVVLPQMHFGSAPIADVSISAMRGSESTQVPVHRPVRMHLGASGLAPGPVMVQIVDESGGAAWEGRGFVNTGSVDVSIPSINETGNHLARLYAVDGDRRGALLSEYSFQVR